MSPQPPSPEGGRRPPQAHHLGAEARGPRAGVRLRAHIAKVHAQARNVGLDTPGKEGARGRPGALSPGTEAGTADVTTSTQRQIGSTLVCGSCVYIFQARNTNHTFTS